MIAPMDIFNVVTNFLLQEEMPQLFIVYDFLSCPSPDLLIVQP